MSSLRFSRSTEKLELAGSNGNSIGVWDAASSAFCSAANFREIRSRRRFDLPHYNPRRP